ncbi:MAG: hypothetical protein COT24_02650 [Candidatus Kerfeldbacteria bacterium CG08_land_8_20_14_0_20_40_16]|uniref:Uncharacterized protein n=1 Tax=Candidatus Kerfeldbacteria bacterium CG08_land_8_20_14_0_20_40_16 TaxID=2014244 RepID=A0A2H0YVT2_9BACT|nr:MAG: hypothetical protein COT24_02650 [Candidatus Kerfeldbacteria bacterium CG08_land_8_20_14_0_20_40_16]
MQVGDKVQVRSTEEIDDLCVHDDMVGSNDPETALEWHPEMEDYCSESTTIIEATEDGFRIAADGGRYEWAPSWLNVI